MRFRITTLFIFMAVSVTAANAAAAGAASRESESRPNRSKLSPEEIRRMNERERAIDSFNDFLQAGEIGAAEETMKRFNLPVEAGNLEILLTMEKGFKGALFLVERGLEPKRVDAAVKPLVLKCDYRAAFRSLLLVRQTGRPVGEVTQSLQQRIIELETSSKRSYMDAQSNLAIALKTKNEDVIYEKGTQLYDLRYLAHSCSKTRELLTKDLATFSDSHLAAFTRAEAEREFYAKLYRPKRVAEQQTGSSRMPASQAPEKYSSNSP